eukprot:255600_1
MSSTATKPNDLLNLSANSKCLKLLQKIGDNFPEAEQVQLSMNIIKINKRGKEMRRILLATDKGLYMVKKHTIKCNRRMDFDQIISILVITDMDLLIIKCESDYTYNVKPIKADQKEQIAHNLYSLMKIKNNNIKMERIKSCQIPPKPEINKISKREDRISRFKELIGKDQYKDELKHNGNKYQQINSENMKLDDLEKISIIGRTISSQIYNVRNMTNGQLFTMKIYEKSISKDKSELIKLSKHSFFTDILHEFEDDKYLYLVSEYYKHDLFYYLKKKKRFFEESIKLMFCEVILSLEYLCSLGIIYDSLKPENVCVDKDGHILLKTDFGFSNYNRPLINRLSECLIYGYIRKITTLIVPIDMIDVVLMWYNNIGKFNNCDTFEYWSPEMVINPTKLIFNKTNMFWSLGVFIYELLVGITPFYNQDVTTMKNKILNVPLVFPPNLSQKCKDLISALLKKNLNERMCDFECIKNHSFFDDMDWNKVYRKEIETQWKPRAYEEFNFSSFDEMFLKEPVYESIQPTMRVAFDDGFDGYTATLTSVQIIYSTCTENTHLSHNNH